MLLLSEIHVAQIQYDLKYQPPDEFGTFVFYTRSVVLDVEVGAMKCRFRYKMKPFDSVPAN